MKATQLLEKLEGTKKLENLEESGEGKEEKEEYSSDPGERFLHCALQLQTQARIFHLQTTSYAQHKALDDLYSGMEDFQDQFMEIYQGAYGRVKAPKELEFIDFKDLSTPVEFIKNKRMELLEMYPMFSHRGLINLLDEILNFFDKIIYLFSLT